MASTAPGSRPGITPARAVSAWPSYVVSLIVLLAAVYAFSPRPMPPFPATEVHPDGLQINALLKAGGKLLAAGEQGRILIADSEKGPWAEAKVEPQRGSALTQLTAVGAKTLIAVGHDGWILRSENGGASWQEANFDSESSDPLLGIAGPYAGKLYAFGAFGKLLVSLDDGKTWRQQPIVENSVAGDAAAPAGEEDPYADPFANISTGGGIADGHINAMTRAPDGALVMVGERGMIARSTDEGASWTAVPQVYTGSFYGLLALPPKGLLAYGMRGNVFRSEDSGQTWVKVETPLALSLFGATSTLRREIILVGENAVVMVSKDGGKSFKLGSLGEQQRLAAALPLDSGDLLTAGELGLALRNPYRGTGVQP
ncbi:MAG: sialidase [Nevskiaceae bacterium]|nr:MAG: sialidase [Nevskiaceae bacterium]TAM33043.1 MAG: sialidase [Nevskiaceae bacterium]